MNGPAVLRFRGGDAVEPLRAILRRGGLLAVPTESSYGLAADPWNPAAVAAIFEVKGREAGKPLPVVVSDLGRLAGLGIDPDLPILKRLAACWPGAVTAVLPVVRPLPASAGVRTLAVRIPGHAGLRELLRMLATPLTATSANASGGRPIVDPDEAAALLAGWDAAVVDGGILPGGPPSTIVEVTAVGIRLLRPGAVPVERIQHALDGPVVEDGRGRRDQES